jgi:hypothetical protein
MANTCILPVKKITSKKREYWFIYIYIFIRYNHIYINMMIYKGNVGNIIYHLNIYNYNDICAKPRTLEEWRHDGYMLGINLDLRGMQYPIQWIEYCLGGKSMGVWHKKTSVIDPTGKKKPRET